MPPRTALQRLAKPAGLSGETFILIHWNSELWESVDVRTFCARRCFTLAPAFLPDVTAFVFSSLTFAYPWKYYCAVETFLDFWVVALSTRSYYSPSSPSPLQISPSSSFFIFKKCWQEIEKVKLFKKIGCKNKHQTEKCNPCSDTFTSCLPLSDCCWLSFSLSSLLSCIHPLLLLAQQ